MVNILISPLQLKNGTMMGGGCDTPHFVADVFLMSAVLFFGTFIISFHLKDFKNALFFPSKVSNSRYSANRISNI
jgi:hypothetical protein